MSKINTPNETRGTVTTINPALIEYANLRALEHSQERSYRQLSDSKLKKTQNESGENNSDDDSFNMISKCTSIYTF